MKIYKILILEIVTVIFVFCVLTTVKFLFPKTFKIINQYYVTNFCTETDINLVIGE